MSKDNIKKIIPHKLDITIMDDYKVGGHNINEKKRIGKKDLEQAYIKGDYYFTENIDFSNTSIPIESFQNTSTMSNALWKESEKIYNPVTIFDADEYKAEKAKKNDTKSMPTTPFEQAEILRFIREKKQVTINKNIGYLLDMIFHKNDVSIGLKNNKYRIASFKWDGNNKESLDDYSYKINVHIVLTSSTGMPIFDGARRFCTANSKALHSAVKGWFGRASPVVKGAEKVANITNPPNQPNQPAIRGGRRRISTHGMNKRTRKAIIKKTRSNRSKRKSKKRKSKKTHKNTQKHKL